MRKNLETENAPKAIGPYSQAVIADDLLITSGQIALIPDSGQMIEGGIEQQTNQVLANLKGILDEAGLDVTSVIKTTIFLKDLSDFETVNRIYGDFFKEPFPARATVEVARLPKDALVEIDLMAKFG
jgi:2-iminobutanoate/2-iminopropanoate deaminase